MTTLTNEQIVGELGWSLQIMSNLNNGRISRFWRPPYGDVDNRVRAIAKGVFGLETVVWTHDTSDWNLDQGGSITVDSVVAEYTSWLQDKSQGINSLEHEVRTSQADAFKRIFPKAKELGWKVANVADTFGIPWYQNAAGPNSTVTEMAVAGNAPSGGASAGPTSSALMSASASASSSASSSASESMVSSLSARSMPPASRSQSPTSSAFAAAQSLSPSSGAASSSVKVAQSGFMAGLIGLMAALVM